MYIDNNAQQGEKSKLGLRNKIDSKPRGNEGKKFEKDIQNSIPNDVFCYHLKDDGMKFAGVCNPCDFLLYKYPFLYLWELKSHKGKSIPFTAIREQQLRKLTEIEQKGVSAGFIFNFRDLGETYWVEAMKVLILRGKEERKSISVEWCRTEGIRIEQSLKRVRFYYDILRLLEELDGSLSY